MKKIEKSLFVCLAFVLTSLTLHAIPNQIGGFVNVAGMRFENFAGEAKTWQLNAKLPGKWEDWKDPKIQDSGILIYRLGLTADVFGIRASQITVQVKDDKIIKFDVVFDKNSSKSVSLIDQLTINIKSFTGESGGKEKKSFTHNKINIQLKDESNGSAVVTFSPLSTAVAAK